MKKYSQSIVDDASDCEDIQCLKNILDSRVIPYKETDLSDFNVKVLSFEVDGQIFITDVEYIDIEEIRNFLPSLSLRQSSIEDYFNRVFGSPWMIDFNNFGYDGDQYGYHVTDTEKIESIMRDGLQPKNNTRGISNRGVGAAVFISVGFPTYSGEVMLRIDIPGMMHDNYLPDASLEPDVVEKLVMEHIASRLGDRQYQYDLESGTEMNTIIVYGVIPPKYIKIEERDV
jgi:hypothetical protein